ncbi:hypothetical protein Tco_0933626, partial [Tanacetum coccineum]
MPKFKSFITLEGHLSQEEYIKQIKEIKRLYDLKAKQEKSEQELRKLLNPATLKAQTQKWTKHEAKKAKMMEEYNYQISFRADPLPIIKICYVVNSKKEATMNITRGDNPLNLIVHPNFRLKTLGFSEWLEVHALASKNTVQLIKLLKHINQDSPEAREMYNIMEMEIESRDDVNKAREIVRNNLDGMGIDLGIKDQLSAKHQLAVKGLSKCKASESNIRRIQVKDIVKEVEDYLKTYSSAGMDISWSAVSISCP